MNISFCIKFLFQDEFRTFKSAPAIAARPLVAILQNRPRTQTKLKKINYY